jgi:uncharacterized protein YndB with AHSA1/START domain
MTTVVSEILVSAPPSQAYRAFTNATALREWLCDLATVDPHVRGRIYLWWNGDFYSSGHYLELETDKCVKFRWFSSIDSAPTEVAVTFETAEGGTLVRMAHTVPDGSEWQKTTEGFKHHWDISLPNLKSVLETGIDLRIANRPLLGIYPSDLTPEQAARLGVPVKEGAHLDGVIEGMGAAEAGLQQDDVVVSIDGKLVDNDFRSVRNAISGKIGGDTVQVEFYRGPEKKTVAMRLSKRPMPEVPFDALELAKQARAKYEAALVELEKCFAGVTDAQAAARPQTGAWSALDVLAHLMLGERFNHFFIEECAVGYERWADGFGGNVDMVNRALVAVSPTISAMLQELRRNIAETTAVLEALPPEFAANKGSFYRVASTIFQGDTHIIGHIPQIKAAIAAAKGQ